LHFTSDISFSIYNAYNRMNPFFIFIDAGGDVGGGTTLPVMHTTNNHSIQSKAGFALSYSAKFNMEF
jgi:hypothetical protein